MPEARSRTTASAVRVISTTRTGGPSRPDACILEVKATSLNPLIRAVASDPVQRQHDVFPVLRHTPHETAAATSVTNCRLVDSTSAFSTRRSGSETARNRNGSRHRVLAV